MSCTRVCVFAYQMWRRRRRVWRIGASFFPSLPLNIVHLIRGLPSMTSKHKRGGSKKNPNLQTDNTDFACKEGGKGKKRSHNLWTSFMEASLSLARCSGQGRINCKALFRRFHGRWSGKISEIRVSCVRAPWFQKCLSCNDSYLKKL